MHILLIGKYPPIEGGVSSHNYWFAREFGRRGHRVTVVTNASLQKSASPVNQEWWRESIDISNKFDADSYQPDLVSVCAIGELPPHHIPYSSAYVSALVGEALLVLKRERVDIIFAHYFEPYGVAGLILKKLTGLPLVVKHAGSDLTKLYEVPRLRALYNEVLSGADHIITGAASYPEMRQVVKEQKAFFRVGPYIPEDIFLPTGDKLELGSDSKVGVPDGVPIITFFGKASDNKGLMELIDALGGVDVDYRLLLVPARRDFFRVIEDKINNTPQIRERHIMLDLIPPWRIPALLRTSSLTISLEHNFPVRIHYPTKAFESIMCGTPALLSGELFQKTLPVFPGTHKKLRVISDPRNTDELKNLLRKMLVGSRHEKEMILAVRNEYLRHRFWDRANNGYEELFERAAYRSFIPRIISSFK
jgi:glycosyltransferase involved in cell wall biosynthesis